MYWRAIVVSVTQTPLSSRTGPRQISNTVIAPARISGPQIAVVAKIKGFNAMKSTSIGLELTGEEILFFRMPDEALEIVAGAAKQMTNFSIGYCSALSVCDG
jgi:hypothetical protein